MDLPTEMTSSQFGRFYAYVYRDSNGQPFYVGKGSGVRAWKHLNSCHNQTRRSYRTMFYTKLRKMLRENVVPTIEPIVSDVSESVAFQWERFFIVYWGRRDIGTGCLCNHTGGGEGLSGYVPSEKVRQKMRVLHTPRLRQLAISQRGQTLSAEHRAKLSAAQTGRKHSQESIEKTASAHRGRKRSPETRRRISEGRKNPSDDCRAKISQARKIPAVATDPDTGEELMVFNSALDASRFFGISNAAITACLKGHSRTSAGCGWRYAGE